MFTELLLVSRLICSDVKMALTVKQQYIFFAICTVMKLEI